MSNLAEVERAARAVVRIYRGLANDENDGEFALWSEHDLVHAIVALDVTLYVHGAPVEPTEAPMGRGVSGHRQDTGGTILASNPCIGKDRG
jgi:hypothetical protein